MLRKLCTATLSKALNQVNRPNPILAFQKLAMSSHDKQGPGIQGAETQGLDSKMFELKDRMRQVVSDVISAQDSSSNVIEAKTKQLVSFYTELETENRLEFLSILGEDFGVNHKNILHLSQSFKSAQERGQNVLLNIEDRLRQSLIPKYQVLFKQIGHLEGGVKFLVDIRADILNLISSQGPGHYNPHLRTLSNSLKELISVWFSVGLVHLQRVTWQSSCDMLQKISDYEAVHPIRNWADLKRRVGPYRRCFVFTHNSMPLEPVVVLHTALTSDISDSIQSIVRETGSDNKTIADTEDTSKITTAVFYSITSTQKGLQGVDLGNYLIKRVVRELLAEYPRNLTKFSSLSPIPGFRDWLITEINKHLHHNPCQEEVFTEEEIKSIMSNLPLTDQLPLEAIKKVLLDNSWAVSEALRTILEGPLMRLCAKYLYIEKHRGYALNPVAHFHLRNGAVMWRLNWKADVSPRGLSSSCGIMVNYRYFLSDTEQNSKNYMERQHIEGSAQVRDLIQQFRPPIEHKSQL
ncbi:unnamed protein product [Owenia fusiformis]|uniref:Malonyl-CoA decarboxylase n=1 Tax=Owenia fusiformis TaxID=6347 RepID=A0A8S4Q2I3_OWEFU|nr:unnamed protein product [Owenia fusiformis]